MHTLNLLEIEAIAGGVERQYDWVPDAQSELGNRLNDATNMLGNWGAALGGAIYDWTH